MPYLGTFAIILRNSRKEKSEVFVWSFSWD